MTGPSGEVSVTPAGGDTTTVEASTGGGSVDTDGDVDIDPPSVDVTD
ncbi:hypothetical protein [Tsukamurella sp. PLM1]|nr:hypothetical protein [Tsukamurella sp. PLM1]